jgi:hypothetical protein
MTDDTSLVPSPLPVERIVPLDYQTVDAAFWLFWREAFAKVQGAKTICRQLSSGSSEHIVQINNLEMGGVFVAAFGQNHTVLGAGYDDQLEITTNITSEALERLVHRFAYLMNRGADWIINRPLPGAVDHTIPTTTIVVSELAQLINEDGNDRDRRYKQDPPDPDKVGWDGVFEWFYGYAHPKLGMSVKRLAERLQRLYPTGRGKSLRNVQRQKELYDEEHGTGLQQDST